MFVSSVMTFTGAIFTPFYVTYVRSIEGSFILAGSSLAFLSILTGVFVFFIGKIEMRYLHKRNLMALGYAFRGAAFIALAVSSSSFGLLGGLVLMSIGTAISLPAFDVLYTRNVSGVTDSSVDWANLQSLAYLVTGLAALAGTFLIEQFGFREIFIMLGFLAFVMSLYVHRVKDLE